MKSRMHIYSIATYFNVWVPGNLEKSQGITKWFEVLQGLLQPRIRARLVTGLLQACYSLAFLLGLLQACWRLVGG